MDASIVRRPPFGTNPLVGERGVDTRRRVLASALEVFGETAYAEARVEQITERAGCSRPAFYQYFSSKDDVFWALATELSEEMVALADQLGPIGPDADGLAALQAWVEAFMALHEAWAPVFDAFPAASRSADGRADRAGSVSGATGRALLKAFGLDRTAANRRVVTTLVAVLIRCSFFAEHTPEGLPRTPLAVGVARAFHRTLAGPVEGVNVVRRRSGTSRRRLAIPAPEGPPAPTELQSRGELTRRKLLDAGKAVLPARGYHDARVDDIVQAAGVSHGTFYRYFEGKDDFFQALAAEASTRMIELVDRLDLAAPPDVLAAWLEEWFDAYEADGGVISTWQEMRTSPELAEFSQLVAAAVFARLEAQLGRRDFGDPQVDAAILLALVERAPYRVFTLGFSSRSDAIAAALVVIRRGLLAID